jgi:hypothetical protein
MSHSRRAALASAAVLQVLLACSDSGVEPVSHVSRARSAPDLVSATVDRVITAEEFALADVDKVAGICTKTTSSTNILMKDANAATPSQPCPAGWGPLSSPATLTVSYEWWMDDDKNGNGAVCVRFVGTDGKAIVKDDNTATPSQPCPPSFTISGKISAPKVDADAVTAADDDGDKMVCVHALPSGNFIARDDNNATPSQPCPPAWAVVSASGGGAEDPADPAGGGK